MIAVDTLEDVRVAPYRWVAEPARLTAAGLVVVEGRLVVPRLLALASRPGRWRGAVVSILLSPAAYDRMRAVVDRHPDIPVYVAPQPVMDGVGFNVHRGCLALARRPLPRPLDRGALEGARRLVVLEAVNNPDNVGGIFRSAAALGADLVILGPRCADPLYRKSVRTSMGASLEVPCLTASDWPAALDLLRAEEVTVAALTTSVEATPLAAWPVPPRVALLAGAEGPGLSEDALARADVHITIPMDSGVDSLNVATAVSIALYHVSVGQPS